MTYMGCTFTWTKNSVWCKLDRVMINQPWLQAEFFGQAKDHRAACHTFHRATYFSWKTKDIHHSNSSICGVNTQNLRIWSRICGHSNGMEQNSSHCAKKVPLKLLNNEHYAHISARAKKVKEIQIKFKAQPGNGRPL